MTHRGNRGERKDPLTTVLFQIPISLKYLKSKACEFHKWVTDHFQWISQLDELYIFIHPNILSCIQYIVTQTVVTNIPWKCPFISLYSPWLGKTKPSYLDQNTSLKTSEWFLWLVWLIK